MLPLSLDACLSRVGPTKRLTLNKKGIKERKKTLKGHVLVGTNLGFWMHLYPSWPVFAAVHLRPYPRHAPRTHLPPSPRTPHTHSMTSLRVVVACTASLPLLLSAQTTPLQTPAERGPSLTPSPDRPLSILHFAPHPRGLALYLLLGSTLYQELVRDNRERCSLNSVFRMVAQANGRAGAHLCCRPGRRCSLLPP